MVDSIRLSFGCLFSDRVEALIDGRVGIEGFVLDATLRQSQPLFREILRSQPYDLAEMSLGSHIAAVGAALDAGELSHYVALPVFLSRSFRHSNIYIRNDRGIEGPADLAGKRVGVIDFQQTAVAWVRGMLADDYGVARESIQWVAGGLQEPVLEARMAMVPKPGLSITRSDSTLDALLQAGMLDAVISPSAPQCFVKGDPSIVRLFRDYQADERRFHQRTGFFPLMHGLVLRRDLVRRHPALPARLYQAFDRAKELALADLDTRDYPKVSIPWLAAFRHQALAAFGGELWHYGTEPNRREIEALLRYAEADGLTTGRLSIDDVFIPL
ncbi:MAG TPA: hypothetical protein VL574_16130 [Stellaceae bacterium]|jgi:4,5-dihydroxyphthalate decarboxylase|nr:hypothetical protein [Stellaceae bacterium]